jgi:integrase
VSEATGADIEHLGLERGHRTLVITRKGGKVVTIPLAPRTARARPSRDHHEVSTVSGEPRSVRPSDVAALHPIG